MNSSKGYQTLETNKEEIINLYHDGWGRVKIARKYGVKDSQARTFLSRLVSQGSLDSGAVAVHFSKSGHRNGEEVLTRRYNKEKNNSIWAVEHSREIIAYWRQGNSKTATQHHFGIDTYGLSFAAYTENVFEAGYPSMINSIRKKGTLVPKKTPASISTNNVSKVAHSLDEESADKDGIANLLHFANSIIILARTVQSLHDDLEELKTEIGSSKAERDRWKAQAESVTEKWAQAQRIMAQGD